MAPRLCSTATDSPRCSSRKRRQQQSHRRPGKKKYNEIKAQQQQQTGELKEKMRVLKPRKIHNQYKAKSRPAWRHPSCNAVIIFSSSYYCYYLCDSLWLRGGCERRDVSLLQPEREADTQKKKVRERPPPKLLAARHLSMRSHGQLNVIRTTICGCWCRVFSGKIGAAGACSHQENNNVNTNDTK